MSRVYTLSLAICLVLRGVSLDADEAKWIITGQVLNENGEPATDFEIATFWSANGSYWNADGIFPKLDTEKAISEVWNDEGKLAPYPNRRGRVFANGRFEIADTDKDARVVLALNKRRTQGGYTYITRAANQRITIRLEPLVRVHGMIRCAGAVPKWTYACVFPGNINKPPD